MFGDQNSFVFPLRSGPFAFGGGAEQLLPYVGDHYKVFDCPSNRGNDGNADYYMSNANFYTEYELNGYLCSYPGTTRSLGKVTDHAQAAYVYDLPYTPGQAGRAHEGGINCGYLDGHAAWTSDQDLGPLGTTDNTTVLVE